MECTYLEGLQLSFSRPLATITRTNSVNLPLFVCVILIFKSGWLERNLTEIFISVRTEMHFMQGKNTCRMNFAKMLKVVKRASLRD